MAKKDRADELVFCDHCGGSIPAGTKPFVVDQPDGTTKSLCQECMWAAKADEDQPALALDEDITVTESALQSVHHPEAKPVPAPAAAQAELQEVPATGPIPGGVTFTHCKTFVSKATPQALDFMDAHIREFITTQKIRVKHTSMCYGMAGIGSQGTRADGIFVTIWW